MKTSKLLLTLMLTLLLTLLSTPLSAISCPNDAEDARRVETLRAGADGSTDYGRLRLALALKVEEACTLRDQRNAALADVDDTETERDQVAGRVAELERQTATERQKADDRLAANVLLEQRVAELERRPRTWVAVVVTVTAIAVGGIGGYVVGLTGR